MDTVSPEVRSKIMRSVKSKNTSPELRVRKWLYGRGLRYRVQYAKLPGCPDIVMPGRKVAIFVHGCFWHRHKGCKKATFPKSRQDYWSEKFSANERRDAENLEALFQSGWRVAIVWECALSNMTNFERWMEKLEDWIQNSDGNVLFETGLENG